MANNQLQPNQVQIPNVSDACLSEGAQIIQLSSMLFDGTGTIQYTFQGAQIAFKKPSSIRSLYFDARSLSNDVLLAVQGGPTIRIPGPNNAGAGGQGYIPLFWPSPIVFVVTAPSFAGHTNPSPASGPLTLYLFNFKVQPIIW